MPTLQPSIEDTLGLPGAEAEAEVIRHYFALFNLGEFQQVAQLFAEDGHLYPPFESPVVGREAIATYLYTEADGMEADPLKAEPKPSDSDSVNITVWGKVTALVFQVKVAWDFQLTSAHEIQAVRVNLLASLGELLNMRPEAAAIATEE